MPETNTRHIDVKWFAAYRDATGVASEQVSTTASTAAALFAEMKHKHPALRSYRAALLAINDEMSGWDSPLRDGDSVLFFPPVAGG